MDQDVYRIGKRFSLMMTLSFVGILKSKAGLVSTVTDALALTGKCTSGLNKLTIPFTFGFGCYAPLVCVYKESDCLALNVKWTVRLKTYSKQSLFHFKRFIVVSVPFT